MFFHLWVVVIAFEIATRGFRIASNIEEEGKKFLTFDEVNAVSLFVRGTEGFCDIVTLFANIKPTDADFVMEEKFDDFGRYFPIL